MCGPQPNWDKYKTTRSKLLAKVYLPEALLLWWKAASYWRRACHSLASGVSVLIMSCWVALLASSCACQDTSLSGWKHFANVQAPFLSWYLQSYAQYFSLSLRLANCTSLSSAVSVALTLHSPFLLLRSLSCLHLLSSVFISKFTFY